MPKDSLMLCERCGATGATPYEIRIQRTPTGAVEKVLFTLCPACQGFAGSIQPIQNEDEITADSDWLAHMEPITELANDISTMQRQMDQLRTRITERKKILRRKVQSLDGMLTPTQWRRMIEELQMTGETATVFWLEKYSKR